jgi:butyryl-CoA dehydrogenase
VPLIEHADVRRMLLQQKAWVEGALALAFYASMLVDFEHVGDEAARRENELLLDMLTPIVKAWGSEYALTANDLAIQVLGGSGYTREYPVEQCYRDNRINPIHEGTNGIQALDLLGRKAMMHNGEALRLLLQRIGASCAEAAAEPELRELAAQLLAGVKLVEQTTRAVGARMAGGEVRLALANASNYMTLLGHVVIGWMWLRSALLAQRALPSAAASDLAFYRGKLQACRFFFATELPQIELAARLVREADATAFTMEDAWF